MDLNLYHFYSKIGQIKGASVRIALLGPRKNGNYFFRVRLKFYENIFHTVEWNVKDV